VLTFGWCHHGSNYPRLSCPQVKPERQETLFASHRKSSRSGTQGASQIGQNRRKIKQLPTDNIKQLKDKKTERPLFSTEDLLKIATAALEHKRTGKQFAITFYC